MDSTETICVVHVTAEEDPRTGLTSPEGFGILEFPPESCEVTTASYFAGNFRKCTTRVDTASTLSSEMPEALHFETGLR